MHQNVISNGSTENQIILLTSKIKHLTEHVKTHQQDHSSRRGLMRMVNRRKKLLNHLGKTKPQEYLSVTQLLNLKAH